MALDADLLRESFALVVHRSPDLTRRFFALFAYLPPVWNGFRGTGWQLIAAFKANPHSGFAKRKLALERYVVVADFRHSTSALRLGAT